MRVTRQKRFAGHPHNLEPYVLGPGRCGQCGARLWWARGRTRLVWNGATVPGWLAWREATGGVHGHRSDFGRKAKNRPGAKA